MELFDLLHINQTAIARLPRTPSSILQSIIYMPPPPPVEKTTARQEARHEPIVCETASLFAPSNAPESETIAAIAQRIRETTHRTPALRAIGSAFSCSHW